MAGLVGDRDILIDPGVGTYISGIDNTQLHRLLALVNRRQDVMRHARRLWNLPPYVNLFEIAVDQQRSAVALSADDGCADKPCPDG